MTLIYEHDSSGNKISGSKQDLIDAALVCKKISCSVLNAAGHAEVFFFNRLIVTTDNHLCGVTTLLLANFDLDSKQTSGTKFLSLYSSPYVTVFCTKGTETVRGPREWVNRLAMKWFVE